MIDQAPPAVLRAAAACEVFDDACAVRVDRAIGAYCFPLSAAPNDAIRIRVARPEWARCYRLNRATGLYDRKQWLRERQPYLLRSWAFRYGITIKETRP